jgi:hypothetical protein
MSEIIASGTSFSSRFFLEAHSSFFGGKGDDNTVKASTF